MTDAHDDPTRSVVDLDAADDARLTRLTHHLAEELDPQEVSRADLLRALLVVAERNAGVRAAVRAEVQTDAVRRDPSGEVAAIAEALRALSPGTDEARDGLRDGAAALEQAAGSPAGDPSAASEQLREVAIAVEQVAVRDGRELHRATLALAERLQVVRDAVDPAHRTRCSTCGKPVRAGAGGRPERHTDRVALLCTASPGQG